MMEEWTPSTCLIPPISQRMKKSFLSQTRLPPDCSAAVRLGKLLRHISSHMSALGRKQTFAAQIGNFFEVVPEGIFEAYARLTSINGNGTFDDWGFQGLKIYHKTFLVMILRETVGRKLPVKKIFAAV